MSRLQGILGQVESGEQDIDLSGLGENELIDLIDGLGAIARRNPAMRPQVRKMQNRAASVLKSKAGGSSSVREKHDDTAKTKFENRIHLIKDKAIQEGLKSGEFTLVDHELYVVKKADGTYTEMITEADDKQTGLTNLVKGQLPSGRVMLITHVALKEGTGTDPKTVNFGSISANTRNGEFSMNESQKVVSDTVSNEVFFGTPSDQYSGYYRLEAPRMIQNATDLKFNIKLPASPAADTCFKVMMRGVISAKS